MAVRLDKISIGVDRWTLWHWANFMHFSTQHWWVVPWNWLVWCHFVWLRVVTVNMAIYVGHFFTAQCHDVILYQLRWLHFSNTAANGTWFTVYPLLYCGNRWPIGTAYSCIWTPNMVRHNICWHNYAVERGLVVGFCGQPHYCYRPYYPTARFWSPSSYMASDEPFPDRSRPMSC